LQPGTIYPSGAFALLEAAKCIAAPPKALPLDVQDREAGDSLETRLQLGQT
jgi:hypothetical protein